MRILVTGGAGFIGSWVIRHLLRANATVCNVDLLTYAGNLATVEDIATDVRYIFERIDICDGAALAGAIDAFRPSAIIHLAAESHVDRSITGSWSTINTNIVGTYTLLEAARHYWQGLSTAEREAFRFLHVSTDEVFGSLGATGAFNEESQYQPNSPYSASKAASDHLVRAWHHTYGLPTLTTNCSNNYGPYQYPEKLIPLTIRNALLGKPLPVYGRGENIRDWLHVEDHARALLRVLTDGRPGETYAIGGNAERRNIDIVTAICAVLDELRPDPPHVPHASLITYVEDRPGHDLRYAIDATKLRDELGWEAEMDFESALRDTVGWYIDHDDWCGAVLAGVYGGERLGLMV